MSRFYSGQLRLRFLATLAILLLCFSGAQSQNTTQAPGVIEIDADKSLHFLVFGDWGTGTQQQKDVAEALARYAQAHASEAPPQFVISVGDNFYESGVQGVDDPQWRDKFELMYDAERFPMPFISVLGNHDWVLDHWHKFFTVNAPIRAGKWMASVFHGATHAGARRSHWPISSTSIPIYGLPMFVVWPINSCNGCVMD